MISEPRPTVKVRPAVFPDDVESVKKLFLAYEKFLLEYAAVKLDFQNFKHEVANLPGTYAEGQNGALWLAYVEVPATDHGPAKEQTIGCMGLRAFVPSHSGLLKRLYLTPESRGLGASKLLLAVAIARARQLGYKELLLDTLKSMTVARALYEKHGFVETEAFCESHSDGVFYRLEL